MSLGSSFVPETSYGVNGVTWRKFVSESQQASQDSSLPLSSGSFGKVIFLLQDPVSHPPSGMGCDKKVSILLKKPRGRAQEIQGRKPRPWNARQI